MGSISLADDETELFESADGKVLITDYRIRKYTKTGSKPSFTTMMIKDIDAIKVHYNAPLGALTFAALATLAAIVLSQTNGQASGIAGIVAVIAVAYYFITRKYVCEFSTASSSISFPKSLGSDKNLIEVIDHLEHLKMKDTTKEYSS